MKEKKAFVLKEVREEHPEVHPLGGCRGQLLIAIAAKDLKQACEIFGAEIISMLAEEEAEIRFRADKLEGKSNEWEKIEHPRFSPYKKKVEFHRYIKEGRSFSIWFKLNHEDKPVQVARYTLTGVPFSS
jgi:hypothetical protein